MHYMMNLHDMVGEAKKKIIPFSFFYVVRLTGLLNTDTAGT